jgi:LCP family protein required for cell wall assembly
LNIINNFYLNFKSLNLIFTKNYLRSHMKIKNNILVFLIVLALLLSSSLIYPGCSTGVIDLTESTSGSIETSIQQETGLENEAETTGKTTAEVTAVDEDPLQNIYVSNSNDFRNYSFLCPDGWELYENGSGSRVVLKNSETGMDLESIFIFVDEISANEIINSKDDIIDLYIKTAEDEQTIEFFEERSLGSDFFDSGIIGYSYQGGFNGTGNEKETYIDYFIFKENDDSVYSIKYIARDGNREESLESFMDFLESFSLDDNTDKTVEKKESATVNILILGDDSGMGRPGGRVNGRTDIIILLHLNLDKCVGTAVTIPRDTWFDIPGHGEGKINGAHAIGGNELTVKAIEELSGMDIDNYIITDFDGFIPLIDFLGGVTIEVGEDLSDGASGCYLSKGVHHLNGEQALALSRNRHRKGDGSTQPGAFAREREAAKIIVALLEQKSTFERIVSMPLFGNYLLRYTWTDLKLKDVLRLIPVLGTIKASDITITTIPSWPQTIGKASAVAYDKEATAELFQQIKNQ